MNTQRLSGDQRISELVVAHSKGEGQYWKNYPEILWQREGLARIARRISNKEESESYETDFSLFLINKSLADLYLLAFSGALDIDLHPNRLQVDLDELFKEMVTRPKNIIGARQAAERTSWEASNTYCYELMGSSISRQQRYQQMSKDLNSCFGRFGIHGVCEIQPMRVLALTRARNLDLRSRARRAVVQMYPDKKGVRLLSISLRQFVMHMNLMHGTHPIPIVDQTGINDLIDLDLPDGLEELGAVNRQLERYGLVFEEVISPCEMVIIK